MKVEVQKQMWKYIEGIKSLLSKKKKKYSLIRTNGCVQDGDSHKSYKSFAQQYWIFTIQNMWTFQNNYLRFLDLYSFDWKRKYDL